MTAHPANAISYPFAEFPADGTATEVAEGIFWVSTPVPFVGLRQVNVWLLRDGDGWTMVDSGYGEPAVQDMLRAVWADVLGGRPITRLILTHFHPDHSGNMGFVADHWGGLLPRMAEAEWFAANLATLGAYTGHRDDRKAFYKIHGLDAARVEAFGQKGIRYRDGVRLTNEFRRIQGGEILTINGDRWLLVKGEGHAPEHMSLYCAERKILIAGDQILPSITTNVSVWQNEPEGDPLGLFLSSIVAFDALLDPATLVLPSHRRPFLNVRQRLRELDAHHADRLSLTLKVTDIPITAAELMQDMFSRALDGHQIGFAMGEALAHLNHLVERGLLDRLPVTDGVQRFRRRADAPLAARPLLA